MELNVLKHLFMELRFAGGMFDRDWTMRGWLRGSTIICKCRFYYITFVSCSSVQCSKMFRRRLVQLFDVFAKLTRVFRTPTFLGLVPWDWRVDRFIASCPRLLVLEAVCMHASATIVNMSSHRLDTTILIGLHVYNVCHWQLSGDI